MESSVSAEDRLNVWQLCKTYLGGEWSDVCADDLVIKPATGGFVNKILFCFLPDSIDQGQTKYSKVVVKYFDVDCFERCGINLTHLLAVNVILSENNISPKMLAVFEKGNICEYIDSHYFNAGDDINPMAVSVLAQKVAKLHSLNMPIFKDSADWYMKIIMDIRYPESDRESYRNGSVRQEIQKNKNDYKTLISLDLLDEMDWLRRMCEHIACPVVFSHCDLNRRNTLVREGGVGPGLDVFIIDWDWCCYTYRGADFGDYFMNWCQTELDFGGGPFPTDDQMLVFIDAYIREMTAINGNSFTQLEINSRQRLIKEAKVHGKLEMMPKAEQRLKVYAILKDRIFDEYPELQ
ncbi:unnamed protein product [Medioppia subpectinata]|uniref:Uncharacterized protein n=1 Tax=Medioppia subpectinata TaxID=1979941 RepID=A0A7R9LC15_9ACAR|nr:unnamed protein product [Medioppia subpectinata]CAG2117594.1 unnamed protein product [Medioppia subpectinata]